MWLIINHQTILSYNLSVYLNKVTPNGSLCPLSVRLWTIKRIKNRLLAKKEKQDKDRTTRPVSRKEQQDQCKACHRTQIYITQNKYIYLCVGLCEHFKNTIIPMIDRKSPDVQNGPRDVASHVKDIIEGIEMLSVSDSAKKNTFL